MFRRAKILHNFDLILNCTDKLLSNWRARPHQQVHCDIIPQCQNLLLEIFGFIGFDYELGALDENSSNQNELAQALRVFMSSNNLIVYTPPFFGKMYAKLSRQHRKAKAIITRYIYEVIDNEMAESEEMRLQRKRHCLIASLIASMQKDETAEASKNEDERKGMKISLGLCTRQVFLYE